VAAYALFRTDFHSIEAAMDFIFERSEDGKVQHIFVGYLPAPVYAEEEHLPYLDAARGNR